MDHPRTPRPEVVACRHHVRPMGPRLRTGDVVLAASPTEPLGPGAVIVFEDPSGRGYVTHRVVAVDPSGNYLTRGDANPELDSTPVPPHIVRGVGRVVVPLIARPLVWVTDGQWPLVAAVVAFTLASVWGAARTLRNLSTPQTARPGPPSGAESDQRDATTWPPPKRTSTDGHRPAHAEQQPRRRHRNLDGRGRPDWDDQSRSRTHDHDQQQRQLHRRSRLLRPDLLPPQRSHTPSR